MNHKALSIVLLTALSFVQASEYRSNSVSVSIYDEDEILDTPSSGSKRSSQEIGNLESQSPKNLKTGDEPSPTSVVALEMSLMSVGNEGLITENAHDDSQVDPFVANGDSEPTFSLEPSEPAVSRDQVTRTGRRLVVRRDLTPVQAVEQVEQVEQVEAVEPERPKKRISFPDDANLHHYEPFIQPISTKSVLKAKRCQYAPDSTAMEVVDQTAPVNQVPTANLSNEQIDEHEIKFWRSVFKNDMASVDSAFRPSTKNWVYRQLEKFLSHPHAEEEIMKFLYMRFPYLFITRYPNGHYIFHASLPDNIRTMLRIFPRTKSLRLALLDEFVNSPKTNLVLGDEFFNYMINNEKLLKYMYNMRPDLFLVDYQQLPEGVYKRKLPQLLHRLNYLVNDPRIRDALRRTL